MSCFTNRRYQFNAVYSWEDNSAYLPYKPVTKDDTQGIIVANHYNRSTRIKVYFGEYNKIEDYSRMSIHRFKNFIEIVLRHDYRPGSVRFEDFIKEQGEAGNVFSSVSMNDVDQVASVDICGYTFYGGLCTDYSTTISSCMKEIGKNAPIYANNIKEISKLDVPYVTKYTCTDWYGYYNKVIKNENIFEDFSDLLGVPAKNPVDRIIYEGFGRIVIYTYLPAAQCDATEFIVIDGDAWNIRDTGEYIDKDTGAIERQSRDWLFGHNYFMCEECNKYHHADNMHTAYGSHYSNYICDDCINKGIANGTLDYCDACEDLYYTDCLRARGGRLLCGACRRTSGINGYYHKPAPKFYLSADPDDYLDETGNEDKDWEHKDLYFGVEWEMEQEDGDEDETYDFVSDVHEELGDFFYCKHDGSLNDTGVEVVSYPLSYDTAKVMFYKLEALMRDHNMAGSRNCGVHVHINRDYFGNDSILYNGEMCYLMAKFENWTDDIAQRDYSEWAELVEVAQKVKSTDDGVINYDEYFRSIVDNYSGRYHSINKENFATLEFRIFHSGSLAYETLESIECVKYICEYVHDHTPKEVFDTEQFGGFRPCMAWNMTIVKPFHVGDHVKVIAGRNRGATGTIVRRVVNESRYGEWIIEFDSCCGWADSNVYHDGEDEPVTLNGMKVYEINISKII